MALSAEAIHRAAPLLARLVEKDRAREAAGEVAPEGVGPARPSQAPSGRSAGEAA